MATKRWATSFDGKDLSQHPSKIATYDFVQEQARTLREGPLWIFEYDKAFSRWALYEKVDLAEIARGLA